MRIGLYFGSFNPVHNGHLAIAEFCKVKGLFDQIWLVVSPNNPFKNKEDLISEEHRLNMVKLAIKGISYLHACDIEFFLPKPSFTIHTLQKLAASYPSFDFSLLLGSDNIHNFHKWKDYEEILRKYMIYVYPRYDNVIEHTLRHPHIVYLDAPLLPISATSIRTALQLKKNVNEFLPDAVARYIENHISTQLN